MTAEEIAREHQRDLQQLRDFRLMDDDFMTKVFENRPQEMQLVLRIILQMPDLEVVEVRTQVFMENLLKRSVQLDVVATDHGGRMFNVEIQRADEGADPRRARYHSSMMDAHLLARKGTKFYELPEAWVIFITENDIMEEGCPLYQVERRVQGSGRDFHDGSHIVYVNGAYRGDDALGKLMHDFSCADPDEMYYTILAERTRFFKESKEGMAIMCRAMEERCEEYLKKGIAQGEQAGKEQRTREIALRMVRMGKYAAEEIADLSGLSLDAVQRLRAEASGA